MNTITISSQNINNCKLPYIENRTNGVAIFLGVLMLVIGVMMFYFSYVTESALVSSTDVFMGLVAVILSVCLLIFKRRRLVGEESGSVVKKECIYYSVSDLDSIIVALNKQDYFIFLNLRRQDDGNVQMIFYYSMDHQYFAVQVLRYVPFEYEPVSDIYVFRGIVAERFIEKIL